MSAAHRPLAQPAELGINDIANATGYSIPAIEYMIRRGDFPRADSIGPRLYRRWHKQTLLNWLLKNEARIGARYRACRRAITELESELGMN